MSVDICVDGPVWTVVLDRPESRNAVDSDHAQALAETFRRFDEAPTAAVAVLWGAGGNFCAGADLKAVAAGAMEAHPPGDGLPAMGTTRMRLTKPVVAAVEGYAVAGGLELALWCDLRIVDPAAVFGVFCRRWGVPLIDGGTVRLPRLIGEGRALDLVLSGRPVSAAEAAAMGLATRVSAPGQALAEAQSMGRELAALPQECLRSDRASLLDQAGLPLEAALALEWAHGEPHLAGGALSGAGRFAGGAGRHGEPATDQGS